MIESVSPFLSVSDLKRLFQTECYRAYTLEHIMCHPSTAAKLPCGYLEDAESLATGTCTSS